MRPAGAASGAFDREGCDMSGFQVWADLEVRFRDTDAMGHVNNAVFVTYLEVARQAYWKRVDPECPYDQVPFVVASIQMDLRSPIELHDVVRVHLRTAAMGRSSFVMEYEARERDSRRLLATATTVLVTYDYAAQRAMPVPEALRRRLEQVEGRPLPEPPRRAAP
jgi:acyl-CoA thioester hydrolase